MAIKNWDRYNKSDSPTVKGLVNKEIAEVKNKKLIQWVQSTDTVPPHNKKVAGVEVEPEEEEGPEKEREVPPHPNLIYDAEVFLFGNEIQYEKICMAAGTDKESAKESLRKFHLHLTEKEKYPQTRKQIFAGFEKWLLNEKKFNYGSAANKSNTANSSTKLGTSDARTEALRKW